jgi:hypothetical protein
MKIFLKLIVLFLSLIAVIFVVEYANRPTGGEPVGSLALFFENGTTEPEVKTILENCNQTVNYTLDYNSDSFDPMYYIMVDKDKEMNIRSNLKKIRDWNESKHVIKKGNNYIFEVSDEFINDDNFRKIIDKNHLQLQKFVCCGLHFLSPNNGVSVEYANGIKSKLEMNNKILDVVLAMNMD